MNDLSLENVAAFYLPLMEKAYCANCLGDNLKLPAAKEVRVITHKHIENGEVIFCCECKNEIK